jgi:UDP-glucose 4-epimerase
MASKKRSLVSTSKSGRRYLITGGAGFIGSHLTGLLLDEGNHVAAIDNLSTGRLENVAPFIGRPGYQFSRTSITSEVVLDRLASEADIIIHLAAAVGVERIIDHPVETIETNVMGTELVLQAALRYNCRVLIASTSEVYGKGAKIPFGEEDDVLLGPTCRNRWGYAASKMVDEFLGFAYVQEYGLPVVVMRFFNTVGPRQSGQYGMVVPRFVERALKGEPISVYGDGSQCRCFCDVRDVVRAVAGLAIHPDAVGLVVNVGSHAEISIAGLAERVKSLLKSKSTIRYIPYDQAYAPGFEDMQRRVPDTTRIEKLLNWKPRIKLDETLLAVRDDIHSRQKQGKS